METKLEYMKRVLKELTDDRSALMDKSKGIAAELGMLGIVDNYDELIRTLDEQVRIGEDYTRPFKSHRKQEKVGWCEEHSTNYTGDRCNFGEHRRKM